MDVKQAVYIAQAYVKDLFPNSEHLRLEEVEPREDGTEGWRVTLSFEPNDDADYALKRAIGHQIQRVYKVVTLDASGTPFSIKIRE